MMIVTVQWPLLFLLPVTNVFIASLLLCIFHWFQAALEAPRVLNLDNNEQFSGPYGMDYHSLPAIGWNYS